MFSKLSSCLLDLIIRTEPPATSTNDQLDVLTPENHAKMEAGKNGDCGCANLDDRVIKEVSTDENKIEYEKQFEVVWDEKLEKDRTVRFPVRPEAKDCLSYLRTGVCSIGNVCKFNHLPSRKPQYFGSPGGCTPAKTSKVNHSTKPCPPVRLNFMGLPIRKGVRDCFFYMSNGSCKYGVDCWFNHPDPVSVGAYDNQSGDSSEKSILLPNASQSTPGLRSPLALSEPRPYVPPMFSSTKGVTSLPDRHAYQAPVYQPERSTQCSTRSEPLERNVAKFPERNGQPECYWFLKNGYCKHMSACKFHHPKNEIAKPTSRELGDSSLPAVQPLIQEAVVSPSCDVSFTEKSVDRSSILNVRKSNGNQPKPVPKEQNANENAWCELCNIKCGSIQLYKNHLFGKMHTKSLEIRQAQKQMSQASQASQANGEGKIYAVTDLDRKEQKIPRDAASVQSLTGRAHVAKANLGPTLPTSAVPKSTLKITAKHTISEDLVFHKEGKKHGTYGETSQNPKVDLTCLPPAATPPSMEPEDVETKIRKVLECGVQEESVRTFTIGSVMWRRRSGKHATTTMKEKQDEEETAIMKNVTVDKPSDKIRSSSEMSIVIDLKGKEPKLQECGIEVQSSRAYGKNHLAKVEALTAKSEPIPSSVTIPRPNSTDKITTESRKDESTWCQLCDVNCTRLEDLAFHKEGKKHRTKVEKLQNINTVDPTSLPEDAEPTSQKVLNSGEAETVKICTICYVMCTSEATFNSHMDGKRHANKVKKKQAQETAIRDANTTNAQETAISLEV